MSEKTLSRNSEKLQSFRTTSRKGSGARIRIAVDKDPDSPHEHGEAFRMAIPIAFLFQTG